MSDAEIPMKRSKLETYPNQSGSGKPQTSSSNSSNNQGPSSNTSMRNPTNDNTDRIPQLQLIEPPDNMYFVLDLKQSRSFRQANAAHEMTYTVKLKNKKPDLYLNNLLPNLQALFDSLLQHTREEYGEDGVARIYIDHPKLESAIVVKPTYLGHLNSTAILEVIENVLHSAGNIPADEDMSINIAIVKLVQGKGRKPMLNVEKDTLSKRSYITIKNSDMYCLPRAIIVAQAHLRYKQNKKNIAYKKEYDRVRNHKNKVQGERAIALMKLAKIPRDRAGMLDDVPKYEKILNLSICVISARIGNKKVYNGSSLYEDRIFLFHYDSLEGGHFDVITKVNAAMNRSYYCDNCDKGFKVSTSHKCKVWCNICGRNNCTYKTEKVCSQCNQRCRSLDCYLEHKKSKAITRGMLKGTKSIPLCKQFWKCSKCGILLKTELRKPEQHECGEHKCLVCGEYFIDENHKCYMRALNGIKETDRFIFFDFECYVKEGKHIPNHVVIQSECVDCENETLLNSPKCNNCGSRCSMCSTYNKRERTYERELCKTCGDRQVTFNGEGTHEKFCKWLIQEQHSNSTVIAHNAKAYDAYFIYEYCMKNGITPDPVIFSGSKIIYMRIKALNIRIVDSHNFLPMPLAAMPKSFGLNELKKGYFPHLYNTLEHQHNKLSTLPNMSYYDPDSMTEEKRKQFLLWYEQNENNHFNFAKELHDYCVSDVTILREACMKFRKLVMGVTGHTVETLSEDELIPNMKLQDAIDPFSYLTIASVCLGIFRTKYLPEEWTVLTREEAIKNPTCDHDLNCICCWLKGRKITGNSELEVLIDGIWVSADTLCVVKEKFVKSPIAIIPPQGYSNNDRYSRKSIEWLKVLEKEYRDVKEPVVIQHGNTDLGEKVVFYFTTNNVVRYKLDGYFELNDKKYACEFYGCNWHGCIKCFPRDREMTVNNGKSLAQRYRETMLREERLKELGYTLITKWECEFDRDISNNNTINQYVKSLNIQDPINIRDCYYGGRTNALTLHKLFEGEEKGMYVDFCSLYPAVLKYKKFPIGHPIRITKDFEALKAKSCSGSCEYSQCNGSHIAYPYFGVVKGKFLPPKNLYHPVLPVRINDKLKFPLCYKCAQSNNNESDCKCVDEDRAFVHTYCSNEVEVALNVGYRILDTYEVLHWESYDTYDPVDERGGLFTDYINTFLRVKQQASGFPPEIISMEDKVRYVADYQKYEGIQLDMKDIESNPGLRRVSKLALNSFYGKFGQRTNMRKTKFITDIAVLYNLLTDPTKVVADFHIMNDHIIQIEYQNSPDFEPISMKTNVVLAAFCTAWARLQLWSVMNKLGSRVIYHDTDSIIYTHTPGEYCPPLGNYLGDLTNELTCKELNCQIQDCGGHWITEFVSCGPKNYSFKLNTGEITCKVRGFSLNHSASLIINFDSMKKALMSWLHGEEVPALITVKTEIHRDKYKPKVYNRVVEKRYGIVYDKRKVLDNCTTVPYGYTDNCI